MYIVDEPRFGLSQRRDRWWVLKVSIFGRRLDWNGAREELILAINSEFQFEFYLESCSGFSELMDNKKYTVGSEIRTTEYGISTLTIQADRTSERVNRQNTTQPEPRT